MEEAMQKAYPEFKKGQIITYGPGRGNYADGEGGWTNAEPPNVGNPDFVGRADSKEDEIGAAVWHATSGKYAVPAGKEAIYNGLTWGANPAAILLDDIQQGRSVTLPPGYTAEDVETLQRLVAEHQ